MTSSDAPQPPGGPQREDEPEGDIQPDDETDLQQENAETSLDQPSS